MRRIRAGLVRLRGLFSKGSFERELEEELDAHITMHVDDNIRAGMTPDEARRQAILALGGIEQTKERYRDRRGVPIVAHFAQDLRYGLRAIRKNPGFGAVAVLTTALGIGANTAVFTLLNAAILRPLPVHDANQLVYLQGGGNSYFSYPLFERLRARTRTLDGVFATTFLERVNVVADGHATVASGTLVSGDYFGVLSLAPYLGRVLTPDDDRAGNPVAVISYGFWRSRFAADPAIVGKSVALNSVPVTIVGVTPLRFFGVTVGRSSDLTLPMRFRDRLYTGSGWWDQPFITWLQIVARLRPGVSRDDARAELDGIYRQSLAEFATTASETDRRIAHESHMEVLPASTGLASGVQRFAPALRFLMWIAAVVLLIACANVANLLLARSEARQREIAIRLALGASRARLIRQFLTESALVGAAGGALGLLFAIWGSQALTRMVSAAPIPMLLDAAPDWRVLGFTAVVSVATVLLFGLAPAWGATASNRNAGLSGLRSGPGTSRLGWNRTLVASQVALSLVLVIAAGHFIRTVNNLLAVDAGYSRQNVLMFSTDPSLLRYDATQTRALCDSILNATATLPGVSRATASFVRPIDSGIYLVGGIGFIDARTLDVDHRIRFAFNVVSPGYFSGLDVPLLMGRDFGTQDTADSPKVAIVNETMARQLFSGNNPLGRQFGDSASEVFVVAGVVKDTKYANLLDAPRGLVYFPINQTTWGSQVTFLLRYTGAVGPLTEAVRRKVAAINPNLPIYRTNTLEFEARGSLLRQRLLAAVSMLFGATALLLACVGLYGLMSFSVARRSKEIGVRMALGAGRSGVRWMIVRDSLRLIGVGIVIGVPSAILLMRLARSFLFGLTTSDPLTLATAVVILAAVALSAAYVPARRASHVDPMVALRIE
jgi:predicted permease